MSGKFNPTENIDQKVWYVLAISRLNKYSLCTDPRPIILIYVNFQLNFPKFAKS